MINKLTVNSLAVCILQDGKNKGFLCPHHEMAKEHIVLSLSVCVCSQNPGNPITCVVGLHNCLAQIIIMTR